VSQPTRRRLPAAAFIAAVAAAVVGLASPAAAANPVATLPIDYDVSATTTLASLGQTVTTTGGSFVGAVTLYDDGTASIGGNMSLPPASQTLAIAGIPLATATFAVVPNGPVSGTVDLATMTATTTASFNIRITSVRPTILPWLNLVGSRCTTAQPISVTMSGPISLAGGSSFSGSFTMPRLKDCGLLTPILNLIVPGPGNTFSASFAPAAP
jgi:hypothetical protein